MVTAPGEADRISLRYFAQQHCARQWAHFIAAMFAEFEERVDPAEADQFLETLGSRMAQSLPLRRCDSLEELEEDINAVLEGIDWGWVRIEESGGFIEIEHGAYPLVPQDESRRSWIGPALEGLYTEWMTGQGGDPTCSARLAETPAEVGAPMRFAYGRHE
ncbi:MAG TPA: cellulose biosynthesis protein BcsD [Stellaceae bacterium]|jgi:hypothetical protein